MTMAGNNIIIHIILVEQKKKHLLFTPALLLAIFASVAKDAPLHPLECEGASSFICGIIQYSELLCRGQAFVLPLQNSGRAAAMTAGA